MPIKEVELVEDVVELLLHQEDAQITESAKEELQSLYSDDLVMVEKELPLKITDVELITEEYIAGSIA